MVRIQELDERNIMEQSEMTLEQLKAYAYDLMVARDRAQIALNKVNQEIARREQQENETTD
jgi:hypothetical protein